MRRATRGSKRKPKKEDHSTLHEWGKTIFQVLFGGISSSLVFYYVLGINNQPPVPSIKQSLEHPQTTIKAPTKTEPGVVKIPENQMLGLSASDSTDHEDSSNISAKWEIRRESEVIHSEDGVLLVTTSPNAGVYKLSLTVTDQAGKSTELIYDLQVVEPSLPDVFPRPISSNDSFDSFFRLTRDTSISNTEDWWLEWNSERHKTDALPENALIVNWEKENSKPSEPIYLCRAQDEGILKPGKLLLSSGKCDVPRYQVQGSEINSDRATRPSIPYEYYEVLIPQGLYKWSAPNEASANYRISADRDYPDETVICRLEYGQDNSENNLRQAKHPGILDQATNHCIFPWGNVSGYLDTDGRSNTYEILVVEE